MQAFYTVLDTSSVEEVLYHSLLPQELRAGAQERKGQVLSHSSPEMWIRQQWLERSRWDQQLYFQEGYLQWRGVMGNLG